jgi:hypothetical protein
MVLFSRTCFDPRRAEAKDAVTLRRDPRDGAQDAPHRVWRRATEAYPVSSDGGGWTRRRLLEQGAKLAAGGALAALTVPAASFGADQLVALAPQRRDVLRSLMEAISLPVGSPVEPSKIDHALSELADSYAASPVDTRDSINTLLGSIDEDAGKAFADSSPAERLALLRRRIRDKQVEQGKIIPRGGVVAAAVAYAASPFTSSSVAVVPLDD